MGTLEQSKKELELLLQSAIIFELSTIPAYMTALLSIKPNANRVAANILRSVMMEEMLHMTLAGNVLSSINRKIDFEANNIPAYPVSLEFQGQRFKEREFDVDLAPMTPKNIKTFTRIELPEGWKSEESQLKAAAEIEVPGYTVGEFYQLITDKLTELCEQYGEDAVFNGNPEEQININYYWSGGGKPCTVCCLNDAKKAIQVIVEQGEGTPSSVYDGDVHYFDQPAEVAHFFRFNEILYGRHYKHGDDPHSPPTGEQFDVDFNQVYPIKINAKTSDYQQDALMAKLNMDFNRQYTSMLNLIAESFNGSPEILYTAILNGMHNMVGTAQEMVKTPITDNTDGLHGAPSFEWVNS